MAQTIDQIHLLQFRMQSGGITDIFIIKNKIKQCKHLTTRIIAFLIPRLSIYDQRQFYSTHPLLKKGQSDNQQAQ